MKDLFIRAEGLTKYYGNFPALLGANFEVHKGEIVGLLGPNGAGKTTLMQILTSIILPTSGNAWIGGFHIIEDSLRSRRMIGYCSEKSPLYLDMTVSKYLSFVGDLKEVRNKKERIYQVIDECGLESVVGKIIGKLSKGFRQRVSLAQAMLNDPSVLILDEPTIGLDPEQIKDARGLIKEFASERATLFSTHILHEASLLCDRVIIMDRGKILAIDTPARLDSSLGGFFCINLVIEGPRGEVDNRLREIPEVAEIGAKDHLGGRATNFAIKTADPDRVTKEVTKIAREKGWDILQLSREQRSLEEIFHEILVREKEK
jgi:ABC-2 type transport system ATP-binding protein